jgi:hypothetical protein
VTALLSPGLNRIGAILGDGWYCGHIAWLGRQIYGERPKLLAQLEICFSDGGTQIISTDESWQTAVGPILEADLIMGETYDARLELQNWDLSPTSAEKDLDRWSPAGTFPHPPDLALVAQNTSPVRAREEITPVAEPAIVPGRLRKDWVFDFGQNLVGRVRLKVTGKRGTTITLRFGEVLENGRLYTKNLRSARQTDYYTIKGDPAGEVYESHFTFHGFREPGFMHIILEPRPGGGITFARGIYRSPYGLIESHWRVEDEALIWDISVPCNTTATAHIPADAHSQILEGGIPLEDSPGVELLRQTPEAMVVALQSGRYRFAVKLSSWPVLKHIESS